MPRLNPVTLLILAASVLGVPLQGDTPASFKIVVATPTLPTFAPWYLTSEGTVTSSKEKAAICYTAKEELFCGGSTTPIGAPKDVGSAPFKPSSDPDAVTTFLGVDKETGLITWSFSSFPSTEPPGMFEPAVMKSATFWLRLDGTESVWALFSGAQTTNAVEAKLLADFQ